MLFKAGLGMKKIKLDANNDEETMKENIKSDVKDRVFRVFRPSFKWRVRVDAELPKLLRPTMTDCCWSAKDFKANLKGSQGKYT